jgi:NAD(P)H-hydrate epimerase
MAGVYIHGLAGDLMAEEVGEYSLIARDIVKGIPMAFKNIVEDNNAI